MEEGIVKELGMDMYTVLYLKLITKKKNKIKWITNKDLLYNTWNSAQCHEAAWTGGEFGEE